jgi:hypothetical protein
MHPVIFVGTHHKTGSVLFADVFRHLSAKLGLTYFAGWQRDLDPVTDIWFMEHSRIDADALDDVRGVHVIRHPLNVVYSGYKYHKICDEGWCVDPAIPTVADGIRYDFDGMSYQQRLNAYGESDGLVMEMRGRSYNAIMDMYRWNYDDPRFLTVKFEDLARSYDETFRRIFEFLGLPVEAALRIAARHDLNRLSEREVGKLKHVTDKSRSVDHTSRFPPDLMRAFAAMYPEDLFARLGYQQP